MLLVEKCLVIAKSYKYFYVEKVEDKYALPSFSHIFGSKANNTIYEMFGLTHDQRIEYTTLKYWKKIEYIDYSCDTKYDFFCYILDLSQTSYRPKNYEMIEAGEVKPSLFCNEHRKIYEFFRAIPDLDSLENDSIFGQVYYDDEQFHITLTNISLLEMELDSIERDEAFPLYFYEFVGTRNIYIDERFIDEKEQYRKLYSIKFLSKEERDNASRNPDANRGIIARVDGRVFFSASPIVGRERNSIVIKPVDESDPKEQRIMDLYRRIISAWEKRIYTKTIRDRNAIHRRLDNNYSKLNPKEIEVKVFNVGQANCCYCDLQNRKLFFDIGVTYRERIEDNPSIDYAVNRLIHYIDADDVFISHWDLDHILGVAYNQKVLKNKIWIGPDFKKLYEKQGRDVSLSIINLAYYLLYIGKSELMLIDTSSLNKILFESDTLSIYLGHPRSTYKPKRGGANILNNGGIIMKLQNNKNMLFPGDCDNEVIPKRDINDTFDNIVVPHHGSLMGAPVFMGKDPKGNNGAYICIGRKKGKFCEDKDIDDKYDKMNFKYIFRTRDRKNPPFYKIKL